MHLKDDVETTESAKVGDQQDDAGDEEPISLLPREIIQEHAITAEYNHLIGASLPGLYIIPCKKNPLDWLGVLFIRQGLYQGGIFRFIFHLPEQFPDSGKPRIIFDIPVFHPHISPTTGECRHPFDEWKRNETHAADILIHLERIFFKIDTETRANAEAVALYENDHPKFRQKVAESVRKTREAVYETPPIADPHWIRFTPWDANVHEPVRRKMLAQIGAGGEDSDSGASLFPQNAQSSGLSWLNAEQFAPFANVHSSSEHVEK